MSEYVCEYMSEQVKVCMCVVSVKGHPWGNHHHITPQMLTPIQMPLLMLEIAKLNVYIYTHRHTDSITDLFLIFRGG